MYKIPPYTANFGKVELDGKEVSNSKPVEIVGIIEQQKENRILGCTKDNRVFNFIRFSEEDQKNLREMLEQAREKAKS